MTSLVPDASALRRLNIPRERSETAKDKVRALMDALNTERTAKRSIASTALTPSTDHSRWIFNGCKSASSYRFTGELTLFLHDHRRRVPPQDVDRSIVVGVRAETAVATVEDRLAFATSLVHGPAFRTGLRGVCGVDSNERPATLFKLIPEDDSERAPSLIENASVQTGLLPNTPTRQFNATPRRSRHVGDLQIFHDDNAETVGDGTRSLMVPVAPNAGAFGGKPSGVPDRLEPTLRALLSPRHNALCGTVTAFDEFEAGRDREHLPSGERQRVCDAAVDTDGREVISRRVMLDFAGERNMPAVSIERHGRVLDGTTERAGITELYPADFRQPHGRPFGVEAPRRDFAPLKPEGVIDTLFARRWVAPSPSEEIDESLIKITERLLLAGLRDGCDPIKLRSEFSEFSTLLGEIDPVRPTPNRPLLQRQVVDQTTDARELPEQSFLFGGRLELEFETAMDNQRAGLTSGATEWGQERVVGVQPFGAFAFCTTQHHQQQEDVRAPARKSYGN